MSDTNVFASVQSQFMAEVNAVVSSILILSTPVPNVFVLKFRGVFDYSIPHRSNDPRRHVHRIPLGKLTESVTRLGGDGTVTIGRIAFVKGAGTWRRWELEDFEVIEDLQTHEIFLGFAITLDGDSVSVGKFGFTSDLVVRLNRPAE